jgi:hypothetical protein
MTIVEVEKVNLLLTMPIRVNVPSTAESQFEQGNENEKADPRFLGSPWLVLALI